MRKSARSLIGEWASILLTYLCLWTVVSGRGYETFLPFLLTRPESYSDQPLSDNGHGSTYDEEEAILEAEKVAVDGEVAARLNREEELFWVMRLSPALSLDWARTSFA